MGESEFCRVCANFSDSTNPLFEGSLRQLLPKIKNITGLQLKKIRHLPQNICKCCEKQILQANRFRQRCIKAQQGFGTQTLKSKKQQKLLEYQKIEEQEQVAEPSNEGFFDKKTNVRNGEDELTLLNQEPTKDDDFNSKDCFNILKDNECQSRVEDKLTIEPESSLLILLSNKIELKAHKKSLLYVKHEIVQPNQNIKNTDNNSESSSANDSQSGSEDILDTERKKSLNGEINCLLSKNILKPLRKKRTISNDKPKRAYGEEHNWICDQCGKHFTVKMHFKTHLLRHSGNIPYPCNLCAKGYYTSTDLKRHILKHTGERPYPCKYCEQRFNDKGHLLIHTRREHTKDRPFVCDQCPKSFFSSCTFKAHMVTHSGLRAFFCKLCNVSYKRKTHLARHYRSVMHKQIQEKLKQTLDASPTTIVLSSSIN